MDTLPLLWLHVSLLCVAGEFPWRQVSLGKGRHLPPQCSLPGIVCYPACCIPGEWLQRDTCVPVHSHLGSQAVFNPRVWDFPHLNTSVSLHHVDNDTFYVVVGNPCHTPRYALDPSEDNFWLLSNGSMLSQAASEGPASRELHNPSEYCLGTISVPVAGSGAPASYEVVPYICLAPQLAKAESSSYSTLYPVGLLVSVCFLLATMAIYIGVPDLRDLHGKALVCHLACQAGAYLLLVIVQVASSALGTPACRALATIIQFLFTASFFWLSAMAFDSLWCVMEATGAHIPYPGARTWSWQNNAWVCMPEEDEEGHRRRRGRQERLAFGLYSLYAWLGAGLPTLLLLGVGLPPTIPNTYLEYNMQSALHCKLKPEDSSMVYLYSPIAAVLMASAALFVVTFVKVTGHHWNLQGPQRVPKQKARMCLMLFVLMSLNWLTDLTSWSYSGPRYKWGVLSIFNILQGVVTFFIFVFEVRVKVLVREKLWPHLKSIRHNDYVCCPRPRPRDRPRDRRQGVGAGDATAPTTENTVMLNAVITVPAA